MHGLALGPRYDLYANDRLGDAVGHKPTDRIDQGLSSDRGSKHGVAARGPPVAIPRLCSAAGQGDNVDLAKPRIARNVTTSAQPTRDGHASSLFHALREQARGGVDGSNRKKFLEACGNLNESLKKAPLRRVCLDEPSALPRLMGLEKGARIEEERPADEGFVPRIVQDGDDEYTTRRSFDTIGT